MRGETEIRPNLLQKSLVSLLSNPAPFTKPSRPRLTYSPDATNYPVGRENCPKCLMTSSPVFCSLTCSKSQILGPTFHKMLLTITITHHFGQRFVILVRVHVFHPLNWLKWCCIHQTSYNSLCSLKRCYALWCRWTFSFNCGTLIMQKRKNNNCIVGVLTI